MTGDKHIAFLIPMLIGGFVFWTLAGFHGKYNEQLIDEKKNRNFWTGYILSMVLIIFISYRIFF
nr:hypothetical protein [uncultured Lacibacter sp.]